MKVHSSSTFSFEPAPWAATAAVLVCFAVEAGLAFAWPYFASGLDYTARMKREWMTDPTNREDVLVLGDSRLFSIRPDIVEDALGGNLEVRNYSWPFAGVETIDYFLDSYLHHKQPPRAILVSWMAENLAVSPARMSVSSDPLYQTRLFRTVPAWPLVLRLAGENKWSVLWACFEYHVSPPSVHYRDRIIEFIQAGVKGRRPAFPNAEDIRIRSSFVRNESFLLYDDEVATPEAVDSYDRAAGGLRLEPTLANVAPFRRFLERARANQVTVLLFNAPMPRMLFERFEELGVIAEYERVLNELKASFKNFQVLEPALQVYPDEYFADVGHMNAKGDERFLEFYRTALQTWSETEKLATE